MNNLLVVDFDFFFPNAMEAGDWDDPSAALLDWGHAEVPLFVNLPVWIARASAFINNDLPLPSIVAPEGGWSGFWSRFTFTSTAKFAYADSNAYAGQVLPGNMLGHSTPLGRSAGVPTASHFEQVVLFDAHHDSGYGIKTYDDYLAQPSFSCEDWLLEHQRHGTTDLSVRYPQWKPKGPNETLPAGVLTRQGIDDGQPLDVAFDHVFVCRSGAWVPPWCDTDFLAFLGACPLTGSQVDDGPLDRGFSAEDAVATAHKMRASWDLLDARNA